MKTMYLFNFRKKIYWVLFLFFSCSFLSLGDEQEKHEFSLAINAGFSSFKQSLNEGSSNYKPGGSVSVSYFNFLTDEFGIGTGLEMFFYKGQSKIGTFSDRYMANDGIDDFEFRTTIENYKETQTATYINIPVMIQLQYPLFHDDHLTYLSIGGKIGFPVYAKSEIAETSFSTSGFYPEYNLLLDEPASHGFGIFKSKKQRENLHFNVAYTLCAELGMKWEVGEFLSLYTGGYLDYGLNNVNKKKKGDKPILFYDREAPANYHFNSMLEAKYEQNEEKLRFNTKITPVALGIKIRIAFRLPEY